MSDSFFIHPQHQHRISTIYPATTFQVHIEDATTALLGTVSGAGHPRTQAFNISVDQLSSNNLLQIRLSDNMDQSQMFISTIDQLIFERIKTEQSLNVTFAGFVDHFLKILDATKRSELHCSLSIGTNRQLQFFERRSFRNLVHLSLPIAVASDKLVLHYIQQTLLAVQQQSNGFATQAQRLQSDVGHRDKQIFDLRNELKELMARLSAQENQLTARNSEHVKRLQTDIQLVNEAHEAELRKLLHQIKTLQDTIDYMTKEKYATTEKHNHEMKKFETVREELKQLKHSTKNSHEECERMRQEVATLKMHDRKSEHLLTEQRKQLADLRDQMQAHDKQRSELDAELEAEKHIARTKRMALELATEEISKANSIIVKQSKELSQLSKKVDWRTDVALQQEKRMREIETEVVSLRKRCQMAEQLEKENPDVADELKKLRDTTDELNRKYNRKIQELKKQLLAIGAETNLVDCTNRYQPQNSHRTTNSR